MSDLWRTLSGTLRLGAIVFYYEVKGFLYQLRWDVQTGVYLIRYL